MLNVVYTTSESCKNWKSKILADNPISIIRELNWIFKSRNVWAWSTETDSALGSSPVLGAGVACSLQPVLSISPLRTHRYVSNVSPPPKPQPPNPYQPSTSPSPVPTHFANWKLLWGGVLHRPPGPGTRITFLIASLVWVYQALVHIVHFEIPTTFL